MLRRRRHELDLLHDLRRRRTALDCVAAGTLVLAGLAWLAAHLCPGPVRQAPTPAQHPIQLIEPIQIIDPVKVVEPDQIVTTVELVEEPKG